MCVCVCVYLEWEYCPIFPPVEPQLPSHKRSREETYAIAEEPSTGLLPGKGQAAGLLAGRRQAAGLLAGRREAAVLLAGGRLLSY